MRSILRLMAGAALLLMPGMAAAQTKSVSLEKVADFPHQVTGVSVTEGNRVFVNFPRWTEDSPVSVAEVGKDGSIEPYPNAEWNAWRNVRRDEMTAAEHFVCVQSVVADGRGHVWVLDAAAPAQSLLVPNGAKLVRIDLASDTVTKVIPFDMSAAPQGSYLNDVRFTADGRYAFVTDSGATGALLVVDLESGETRRLLDGHPSTQVEKGVRVSVNGEPVLRPDGRGVAFSADGIALSNDGQYLYWQAIKGRTLYRIPTQTLIETGFRKKQSVADAVESFGDNGVSDGLWIGRGSGDLYVSAVEENAVKLRDLSAGPSAKPQTLIQDKRLNWPDTFSEGPDGTIYVTTSRIPDMAFFEPNAPAALPTTLWRIKGSGAPAKRP